MSPRRRWTRSAGRRPWTRSAGDAGGLIQVSPWPGPYLTRSPTKEPV
ncbi:hypothetical protein [Ornithinimicrobium kibberense]